MFTLPHLRVATIEGQRLYPYDIVIIPHAHTKQQHKYMVFYDERMFAFSLIPLDGVSFATLPVDYLDRLEGDWEYVGPVDEDTTLSMPGPHDTPIENLFHYLKTHYEWKQ